MGVYLRRFSFVIYSSVAMCVINAFINGIEDVVAKDHILGIFGQYMYLFRILILSFVIHHNS